MKFRLGSKELRDGCICWLPVLQLAFLICRLFYFSKKIHLLTVRIYLLVRPEPRKMGGSFPNWQEGGPCPYGSWFRGPLSPWTRDSWESEPLPPPGPAERITIGVGGVLVPSKKRQLIPMLSLSYEAPICCPFRQSSVQI